MVEKISLLKSLREATERRRMLMEQNISRSENLQAYGRRRKELGKEEWQYLKKEWEAHSESTEALISETRALWDYLFKKLDLSPDRDDHWEFVVTSIAEIIKGVGGAKRKWSSQQYYEPGIDVEEATKELGGKVTATAIAKKLRRKPNYKHLSEDRLRKLIAKAADPAVNPGLLSPTLRLQLNDPVYPEFDVRYSSDLLNLPKPTDAREAAYADEMEILLLDFYRGSHEAEGQIWTKNYEDAFRIEVRKMARHIAKFDLNKRELKKQFTGRRKPQKYPRGVGQKPG